LGTRVHFARGVDTAELRADNPLGMHQSAEQVVRQFRKALAANRKNSSPAKAKAFLLRAGIAEKSKSSPSGVRLAKRFR
jgi:hypothetical protein